MDASVRAAQEQMSTPPTADNYVLGKKVCKPIELEAKKGKVADDMLYWYMAVMYALNPTELLFFANSMSAECNKVRAARAVLI